MNWFHRDDDDRHRRRDDIPPSEIARALENHIRECREDKAELRRTLVEHAEDVNAKHGENQREFNKINRTIYIAMGIGTAIVWFLSHVVTKG